MAHKQTRRQKKYWPNLFLVIFLLSILFLGLLLLRPGTTLAFDSEPISDFSENWSLRNASGGTTPITLPTHLYADDSVSISKFIPQEVPYPAVLGFRSAHQRVRLYCDGQLIYSFGYDQQPLFGKSPGSAWHLIRLPQACAGKQLVLELDSPYTSYQGRISTLQLGSKAALLFSIVKAHIVSLALTAIIFVSSVMMLLGYYLVLRKDRSVGKDALYLGMFSLFVSMWLFGEGQMIQFFGLSPAFNTCFTLLAMLAIPIPLVYYLSCGRRPACRLRLEATAKLLTLLYALALGLQALGILDFIQQMPAIHTIFILVCILLLWEMVADTMRQPSTATHRLLLSLGILAVCLSIETINLYSFRGSIGGMMRLGVLIFIAIQAQMAFQNATHIMLMSRFASVDALTGCFNRAAYNQALKDLAGEKNVGIVIADVNNLKRINDTLGHEVGDDAIISCATCVCAAFATGGQCYRIGGDEFAVVGSHLTQERLRSMSKTFLQLTSEKAKQTPYPFGVSYGYALFDPAMDTSLSQTIRRADNMMYDNKRRMKQRLATKVSDPRN